MFLNSVQRIESFGLRMLHFSNPWTLAFFSVFYAGLVYRPVFLLCRTFALHKSLPRQCSYLQPVIPPAYPTLRRLAHSYTGAIIENSTPTAFGCIFPKGVGNKSWGRFRIYTLSFLNMNNLARKK